MSRAVTQQPKPILSFTHWLILLVLVNFVVRLPLCWDPATVDNDGAEYLAITRQLRTTGHYATDLKWQFFTDDPVQHLAWSDRPPLYPYLALFTQRALPFLDPTSAARVGNALLACVALLLCAVYLRRLFGERVALLATGFVFLLPHTLKWTTQPMTETVTLALTFGALLVWDLYTNGDLEAAAARPASSGSFRPIATGGAFLCGILSGLAYLARPTGALLIAVLVAFQLLRNAQSPATKGPRHRAPELRWVLAMLAGFALCAVPYHFLLWRIYGSPFHSALGFTFAVQTYYEVTYYGFEAPRPSALSFLQSHWSAIPGLVLHQIWRHIQILFPQLLPFLPFALLLRREDWSGRRWPVAALIVGTLLVHTLTWSAWGSSRYFLPCLPLVVALLLSAAERARNEVTAPCWLARYTRVAPLAAFAGLAICLIGFYGTYARADRGLKDLPDWKDAASQVRGARLVASDKPAILNLLLETPSIRLPRTTDTAQLDRFIRSYHPEALVLFPDEPAERPMAAAWRAGNLPPGWRLKVDQARLLIALPAHNPEHNGTRRAGPQPQIRQAGKAPMVN